MMKRSLVASPERQMVTLCRETKPLPQVLCIFGTRPEAIKMAPLVHAINACPALQVKVCVTAQHRQMLDQVLDLFGIKPDFDLEIMRDNQGLVSLSASMLMGIQPVIDQTSPDIILVHGDTTTTMIASLAAYYAKIPLGHVEAGLRTQNKFQPYPEEGNRRITSVLADFHFAPTLKAKHNLLREGVVEERVIVTGNTVIDALLSVRQRVSESNGFAEKVKERFSWLSDDRKIILITGHRRENFGTGFINICNALLELAQKYPEIDFLYPVHLNPNVQQPVDAILSSAGRKNIYLIEPLDYATFVYFLDRCYLVITDSGGVQEEAPSLGKPVIVMRELTERPEAVEAGTVCLVGNQKDKIVASVSRLLDDSLHYRSFNKAINPYGDGQASSRIVNMLLRLFNPQHPLAQLPLQEFVHN